MRIIIASIEHVFDRRAVPVYGGMSVSQTLRRGPVQILAIIVIIVWRTERSCIYFI